MIARAVSDLPDPLSPTMQTVSPPRRLNETLATAWRRSAPSGRRIDKSEIDKSGVLIDAPSTED